MAGPLGEVEPVPAPLSFSVLGGAAFALGALGFVAAWWLTTQRPSEAAAPATTDTSYRAAPWVQVIAEAGYAVANGLSRVQSGLLARYAFGSFIAVAAIVLVRMTVR
jgi:hypothetical protein